MAELLKAWLRTRLGVIMDLTPEMFGRYTKDGTLLAQILHSYDIISSDQLSTILRTQDPALSRVNLKTLRIWLKLINVDLSNECIEDISKGRNAASLQLFYKVYLSLETKDRLHFIALQKEREKYISTFNRFEVTTVCEDPLPRQSSEHPLSKPLIEATDTILWHRDKFWKIVEASRRERAQYESTPYPVEPVEYSVPQILPDRKKEESERLDKFACKHPARKMKKYQMLECCPEKKSFHIPFVKDPAAAAEYVNTLKKRSDKITKLHEQKMKMQTTMLAESWKNLLKKQAKSFDEALARRVLDQSRYEKQIMTKLCEVRNIKNSIMENRKIVDEMLLKTMEKEQRLQQDRRCEIAREEAKDVQIEARRISELQQRLREEKMCRLRKKHRDICMEILRDLVDITVKAVEYRQTNDNYIPHFVWSEWKTLFLKGQPIIELIDQMEEFEIGKGGEKKDDVENRDKKNIEMKEARENEREEEKNERFLMELEHGKVLADGDFENYLDLAAPWDEFVHEREEEAEEVSKLGRVVLGYIVHRLLQVLYPYPSEIMDCPVPRVKIATIISGITNPALHEQLRELLQKNGVRLLRMEDAINHCLERYKQEMADVEYIDLNIIAATTRDIKKMEGKGKIVDSKDSHPKKIEKQKVAILEQSGIEEKQTQTPRQIPYDDMDPILSDTACIGKWTYEFLTLGQPISNELNTKILIEYLKGIGNVTGWVLVNYPNTYEQMAMLEKALTGQEVPPDPKIINFADVNIEDIDPPSPRIIFKEDDSFDGDETYRQSRLLSNPISKEKDHQKSSITFMTTYINVMLKPKTLDMQDQFYTQLLLPNDATSMEEYYANQNIAYMFYYNILDLRTLKLLARFIMGQNSSKRELSLELFGEIPETYRKQQESLPDSKIVIIRRLVPRSRWKNSEHKEKNDFEAESNQLQQPNVETLIIRHEIRPGEDDWQWIDFPQSPLLLEALATLWESMEEAYIENLKEILSLKRIHTSAIVPYKNFVLKNLKKFIDQPDKRQNLLQKFHRAFNNIDKDLREDLDMKCELHCRVADFQAELWQLCDTRRTEAEKQRRRILEDQWTLMEAIVLTNVYTGILQTEIDRFVDTMQLLQDYYTSMLQKAPQGSQFSKIILKHVELEDYFQMKQEIVDTSVNHNNEQLKMKNESIKIPTRDVNINRFKIEIENLLIDVSKSFNINESNIYNAIIDNIRQVRGVVDSISSTIMEMLKKETTISLKAEVKGKDTGNDSPDSTFTKLAKRSRDLFEEWRYAVLFEIHRIYLRLDVLNAAARSEVTFLLNTMKQIFHSVYQYSTERYKREIESIDNMAKVFCFAIEEAKPIQQELLLDGDQFLVRSNVLMFSEDPKQLIDAIKEASLPLQFRMVQLGRLIDIFKRIAPHGTITERGLIYILQDLVSCSEEECYPLSVPCAWRQLRPPDIARLIEQLFGPIEHIEWREFILYAMNLPMPSHEDILKARAAFRIHDPELREVITREQYLLTPLWFLECVETASDREHNLHNDFQRNYEILLDEKCDHGDCERIMNIMLHKEVRLGKQAIADSNLDSRFIEASKDSARDILRLMLAKELLCQMYLTNRRTVNYTAMLLAFCKDEDPREGLGKAFTLAMGVRVCTDIEEGERYVGELLEERRLAREAKLRQDYLEEEANEVVRDILDYIINKIEKGIAILEARISRDLDLQPKRRIMIQKLDGSGEIDPVELLSTEKISEYLITGESSVISDDEWRLSAESTLSIILEDQEYVKKYKVIFWLPRDVCLTVLSTCLPWHASQADLFQTSFSLREEITRVYNELRDEELNNREDVVLAHRLINHRFIRELSSSSKFVSKNMMSLLRNILDNKF